MEYIYTTIILLLIFNQICFAIAAIFSRHLVFSVFSLIFFFFNGIWFFIFYKAEYCMVLFLIIYLGAIVVFFLFVLMLVERKYWVLPSIYANLKNKDSSFPYFLSLVLFLTIMICFFLFVFNGFISFFGLETVAFEFTTHVVDSYSVGHTNVEKIGFALYSEFALLLIIGGLILLVSIIGCVLIIQPRNMKLK
jgi:NADH-quinone oxidoreductase subunit J